MKTLLKSPAPSAAARFAAVATAMLAAHELADYWLQSQREAVHKGADSAKGRIACASHVATYTAVSTAAVVAVDRYLGLDLDPRRIAAGQLLSAATHYAADRREPLRRLACWAGKRPFWESGGAPHLDQAAHKIVLTLAAAITAGGAR
ncbi:DUF3307 domain-containing protein [Nocardiopsis composta]|uniref:DUF3307 domain-containing protein n=1 Tax=Nocardiopsis composta TaxID=157465 RepID=A0A7W8QKA7_9ACTN|nr:DUF3307 domain-containing protein [Nocardiopsis composta]MBB5431373.1 hypothetical protein [Nocardiopsis composta]